MEKEDITSSVKVPGSPAKTDVRHFIQRQKGMAWVLPVCVCVCVYACVRACVRACVCVCVLCLVSRGVGVVFFCFLLRRGQNSM